MITKPRTLLLVMLALTMPASADVVGTFSFNTAPISAPCGSSTCSLDFQFIDGNGVGDANNTVTLSNFQLGGGAGGTVTTTGGVTFGSGFLTMTDSSFFNEAQIDFTFGTSLSFQVDATENPDATGPDTFTFAILSTLVGELPTDNPNGFNSLVEIDLPSPGTPTTVITSCDTEGLGICGVFAAAPEPSSFALGGMALSIAALCRSSRRKLLGNSKAGSSHLAGKI